MTTSKMIAARASQTRAKPLFAIIIAAALAGCSALPSPPQRASLYDFGPGDTSPPAPPPAVAQPPLGPLVLGEVTAPGLPEGSAQLYYRLAYSDAQQLRPYQLARWSQPPAQLVQQRLHATLARERAVLTEGEGPALVRDATGRQPPVLRVQIEEFSHVFQTPAHSVGLVRLRATLTEPGASGEVLRGQHTLRIAQPAASADAAGGAQALAQAAQQAAQDINAWMAGLQK